MGTQAFVEALASTMKYEDFEPWLCEKSVEPAVNWVREINRGLRESDLAGMVALRGHIPYTRTEAIS